MRPLGTPLVPYLSQHTGVKEKRQQRRVANHGLRMWKVAAEADLAFCTQVHMNIGHPMREHIQHSCGVTTERRWLKCKRVSSAGPPGIVHVRWRLVQWLRRRLAVHVEQVPLAEEAAAARHKCGPAEQQHASRCFALPVCLLR